MTGKGKNKQRAQLFFIKIKITIRMDLIMKKLNTAGYYICMLFAVSLFLSEKFTNNVLIYLLCLLFAIGMCFKENRNKFKLYFRFF